MSSIESAVQAWSVSCSTMHPLFHDVNPLFRSTRKCSAFIAYHKKETQLKSGASTHHAFLLGLDRDLRDLHIDAKVPWHNAGLEAPR